MRGAGFLCLILLGASPVRGQPTPLPTEGTVRALVLFVRFADDRMSYSGRTDAQRQWADPDRLPEFANRLLANAPGTQAAESGLTAYFDTQSNGRLHLVGASYPRVLVTESREQAYAKGANLLDLARLTDELLTRISTDSDFPLGAFDADDDGYLDYVFVVLRRMDHLRLYPSHPAGVSELGRINRARDYAGKQLDGTRGGSYVRYDDAGNIFPEPDLVRLMAHEIGHDLWDRAGILHLRPLIDPLPSGHGGRHHVGYALMAGPDDARGDETISAYERDLLGWIDCQVLVRDTTIVLRDLYTGPGENCATVRSGKRLLHLSNRQRIGFFDRLRHEPAEGARSDQGLMDTGLLVTVSERGRFAPVPADGTLALSATSNAYAGDLFQVGDGLGPWHAVTVAGRRSFRAGTDTFQELSVLRILDGPSPRLVIGYRADLRRRPVLDQDTRMTEAHGMMDFAEPVIVRAGHTLTVEGSMAFARGLWLERNARLIVSEGAHLVVERRLVAGPHSIVDAFGELEVRGTFRQADEVRVRIGPCGTVSEPTGR